MILRLNDSLIRWIFKFTFLGIVLITYTGSIHNILIYKIGFSFQFISFVMCCFYLFNNIKKLDIYSLLIILFLFYECVITFITRGFFIDIKNYLDMLFWPLLLLSFYNYSKSNNTIKIIKNSTLYYFFIIAILSIPIIILRMQEKECTIFYVYFLITMIPLILLKEKNKGIKNIVFIIGILLIMATTKRAGFIAIVLGTIAYYITDVFVKNGTMKKIKQILKYILLFLIIIIIAYYFVQRLHLNLFERLNSINADEGSGRVDIWNYVIFKFNNSSTISKAFGHGFQSVRYTLFEKGSLAHNDYIEYLYDFGVIGFLGLVIFNINLLLSFLSSVRRKIAFSPLMLYSFVVTIILSMLSYYYDESSIILPMAIFWGIVLGHLKYTKIKNIKRR